MSGCPILISTTCGEDERDKFAVAVKKGRGGDFVVYIAAAYKELVINVKQDGVEVNMSPYTAPILTLTKVAWR